MDEKVLLRGSRKSIGNDEHISNPVKEEVTETIRDESPAKEETAVPPTVRNGVIVTPNNILYVKVRKKPSFDSEPIEVLRKGDKVKLLKKETNFWKVSTSTNKIAYISSEFIKEE